MSNTPSDIRAERERGVLTVSWGDLQVDFPLAELRAECECAHCVNEWTGERLIDPTTIPPAIAVEKMDLVGSYAVRIHWSDGHNTGLFTWQRLRELAQAR